MRNDCAVPGLLYEHGRLYRLANVPERNDRTRDEDTPVSATQMTNHYKCSKWQAEVVARELPGKGRPL